MKKLLICMLVAMLAVFGLAACGSSEPDGLVEDSSSEVTLYANGGMIWMGADEPYEVDLCASTIEDGIAFADGIDQIQSIEKDGATFDGWTIYAVNEGEWVQEEVTDLDDGQLCVSCGDYGYYVMYDYEVLSGSATTDELLANIADGRSYYALANWK